MPNYEDEFPMPVAVWLWIYAIWTVAISIIDMVVCGDIFYSAYYIDPKYGWTLYTQQLYSLPGMDYDLSHWLQVYGATSVTKLAFFLSLIINPFLVLITGMYLYITSLSINNRLTPLCQGSLSVSASVSNITCQVFNNPVQYQQLDLLNQIQFFGSVAVIGIIPLAFVCYFIVMGGYSGTMCLSELFIGLCTYLNDVNNKVKELFCCDCYKHCCVTCSYIFCYGPKPKKTTEFKRTTEFKSEINLV